MRPHIVPPGLLDEGRPYADRHFFSGYGYWNYRGGILVCWIRGHRWKWCHSRIYPDRTIAICGPLWHLQCVRCLRQELNPYEIERDQRAEPIP